MRKEEKKGERKTVKKPEEKKNVGRNAGKPEEKQTDRRFAEKPEGKRTDRRFAEKPEKERTDRRFAEKPEEKKRTGRYTERSEEKRTDRRFAEKPEEKQTDRRFAEKPEKKRPQIPGQACPVEKRCGGCTYLNRTYEEQLSIKQSAVKKLLAPYCPVHSITGMAEPFHYRNKVHAVFAHRRDGSIVSGTYEEGTHNVVPVERCLLENEKADEIIGSIRGLLKSFKIKTYNEDTGYGVFRHVLIRTAHQTGQIMVVLVLASPILPSRSNFVKALRALHPEITTIVQNINDRQTSMVLGDRETVLYGKGYIEDILCGCRFRISAKSFYQINSVQTEALYKKAMELAALTGKERVIDAYCGIGTIGLVAAKQAGEVIGVELNPDAVRDAVRNAKANEAKNVRFYRNDAGAFLVQMAESGAHADVVFMDPPRAGSDEAFLSSVLRLAPRRIVYISCNPETQARDLAYLTKHGYRAEGAWPYDMFPFAGHVENICLLSRKAR